MTETIQSTTRRYRKCAMAAPKRILSLAATTFCITADTTSVIVHRKYLLVWFEQKKKKTFLRQITYTSGEHSVGL